MTPSDYFQLIPSMIMASFVLALLVVWKYERRQSDVLMFALGYTCGGFALVADFFQNAIGVPFGALLANVLYCLTVTLFAGGIIRLFRTRLPQWLEAALPLAGIVASSAAILLYDGAGWIWSTNIFAMLCFGLAVFVSGRRARTSTERVFLWVMAACALHFGVRAGVALGWSMPHLPLDTHGASDASTIMRLTTSVGGLIAGVMLIAVYMRSIVDRLSEEAARDPLTGLLNRRALEARIALTAPARGRPVSVIATDLDRFKSVNDRFGHAAGDEVLRAFSRLLRATARDDDLVARTGGEEFVVVMPDTTGKTARLFAEGVRTALGELRFTALDGERVTASFGIAEWVHSGQFEEASQAADTMLYQAKHGGRDRTVLSPTLEFGASRTPRTGGRRRSDRQGGAAA